MTRALPAIASCWQQTVGKVTDVWPIKVSADLTCNPQHTPWLNRNILSKLAFWWVQLVCVASSRVHFIHVYVYTYILIVGSCPGWSPRCQCQSIYTYIFIYTSSHHTIIWHIFDKETVRIIFTETSEMQYFQFKNKIIRPSGFVSNVEGATGFRRKWVQFNVLIKAEQCRLTHKYNYTGTRETQSIHPSGLIEGEMSKA